MSRRALTLVVTAALLAVLGVAGSVLPVPYVALQPGPITDTLGEVPGGSSPLIVIKGHKTYPTEGKLALTTVSVVGDPQHHPSLFAAISDWFSSDTAVVPEQLIFPPGEDIQKVEQQNQQDMQESQENAITAALRYLGIAVPTQVTVSSVSSGAPAADVLEKGDVIAKVDGHAINSEKQLRDLISAHKPGESVSLTITRAGKTFERSVKTTASGSGSSQRTVVGFVPKVTHQFPFSIDIGLKDVGGPSAGTMFALGIIDKLTPGALTGGRFVAGTGTIDPQGNVGPIGGVQQKVVAASRAGASVFLVPAGDCGGAQGSAPKGVRLVKISTLSGAVDALEALSKGNDTSVPSC